MFIGHLPGAYLLVRPFSERLPAALFPAAMVGSVLPDIDLLAFYFVDNRAHHHHDYLTHRPILWAGMLLAGLALRRWRPGAVLAGLGLGGLIHMALDSIAGKIAWAWPLSDFARPLVAVPATRSHWILSFLIHWTFLVEIAVCLAAAAMFLWLRQRNRRPA